MIGEAEAREIDMIDLDIDVHRRDDASYVLSLAGEVDMYSAPAFEHELVAAIENGGRELVVDLTEVTFIDSSFLGVLKGARQRLNARGGRISIVCNNRNLTRVFEITGLDRIFSISPTLDDATRPASPPATRHRGLGLHDAAPAYRRAPLSPLSNDAPQ